MVDSGARVSEEGGVETIEWVVREAIEEDILAERTVMRLKCCYHTRHDQSLVRQYLCDFLLYSIIQILEY